MKMLTTTAVSWNYFDKSIISHLFSCLINENELFWHIFYEIQAISLEIKNFMTKSGQTIFKPALAKDIFSKEDFVK